MTTASLEIVKQRVAASLANEAAGGNDWPHFPLRVKSHSVRYPWPGKPLHSDSFQGNTVVWHWDESKGIATAWQGDTKLTIWANTDPGACPAQRYPRLCIPDSEGGLIELTLAAQKDTAAWLEARRLVRQYIEDGEAVPPLLRAFALSLLDGAKQPKKQRPPNPISYRYSICLAVAALERAGMQLSRNAASAPHSAYDFVADKLGKDYETIKSHYAGGKAEAKATPRWLMDIERLTARGE